MSITAHCLVKNEENFIWYALQSVLPFVDRVLVWDTGSTDKTVKIIKSISSSKISFEEKGPVNEVGHTALRNEMIRRTTSDWFMILDGDEVWPSNALNSTLGMLQSLPANKSCILSKFIFCVGDVYHYSTWGQYKTAWGLRGHYTPRFVRNVGDVCWKGGFDGDTLYFGDGQRLVNKANVIVSEDYFFHLGVLSRSPKDFEVTLGHGRKVVDTCFLGFLGHGCKLPADVTVPEIFTAPKPAFVPTVAKLSGFRSFINFINYCLVRFLPDVRNKR